VEEGGHESNAPREDMASQITVPVAHENSAIVRDGGTNDQPITQVKYSIIIHYIYLIAIDLCDCIFFIIDC
jgi:hypothetical protein